jgi:hypothetical protein
MKNIIDAVLAVLTLLIPRLKKETSVATVKETKEALIALNEIGLFLALQFKDGFQSSDFSAMYEKIINDHEFKSKLLLAYENYNSIKSEMDDIDLGEGLELVKVQTEYLPIFIDTFKKV